MVLQTPGFRKLGHLKASPGRVVCDGEAASRTDNKNRTLTGKWGEF